MKARVVAWWRARSPREQRLLRLALAGTAVVGVFGVGSDVARDLTEMRAGIEAQERDLVTVRRLAREVAAERKAAAARDDVPLVTQIEATASEVVGRERIASMTPLVGTEDGVALRLVGASLGDTVRVVHGIERGGNRIEKLDLVKHPDDPSRFDVVLEVSGGVLP